MNEMERNSNNMYAAQNNGGEASDIYKNRSSANKKRRKPYE